MLGGADNPNGELPSYITGADISKVTPPLKGRVDVELLAFVFQIIHLRHA